MGGWVLGLVAIGDSNELEIKFLLIWSALWLWWNVYVIFFLFEHRLCIKISFMNNCWWVNYYENAMTFDTCLGEPPKIFDKSWEFGPRRGGVWPNPNFYKSLFLWHIWPFFAENFRQIHGKKSQRSGRGSSRLGQIPNFYRKLVLGAPLTDVTADLQRMAIANKGDFWIWPLPNLSTKPW